MAAADAVRIDPSNLEQLQAWDGDEGAYWSSHADYFDRSVWPYHERLMKVAEITAPDRVLDIGCGTGQTTRDAARAAAQGSALGVDLSSQMLDYARHRAAEEGLRNVFFEQVDAQIHPFDAKSFDVAIGRSSLMFFGDLAAGLTNIQHSLRPSGRIVFTSWQQLAANEWVREITRPLAAGREIPVPPPDARGPFALSDPDRVRGVLTRAGFCDVEFEAMTAGMWFGTDSDDAFRLIVGMMGWMIEGLDAASRARALDELRSTTMAHETPEGVIFGSASWVIRATRR